MHIARIGEYALGFEMEEYTLMYKVYCKVGACGRVRQGIEHCLRCPYSHVIKEIKGRKR